jgi:cell division initiation protein
VKVTPLDIRRKEFRRSVRGYLDEDVDVFLDGVADEFERVAKVNADLQEKVRQLEEQISGHAHMKEALEKTLVAAQLQAEETKANAQKESQAMLREAEAKAKAVADDFYAQTQAMQQTLMQLKLLEEDFRFKFKALLEGYLKLIEDGPLLFTGLENAAVPTAPAKTADSKVGTKDVGSKRTSEVDDSPTSETTEGAVGLAAEAPVPAPLPPHLPKAKAGKQAKLAAEAEDQVKEGGVYFGKMDEDPDDPFPEIGGESAKPRDFAW